VRIFILVVLFGVFVVFATKDMLHGYDWRRKEWCSEAFSLGPMQLAWFQKTIGVGSLLAFFQAKTMLGVEGRGVGVWLGNRYLWVW
jgi:hypothetical protein